MEVRVTGHNFEKDHPILHASGIGLPPNFEDCVNRTKNIISQIQVVKQSAISS
jgi:hypothetical protein